MEVIKLFVILWQRKWIVALTLAGVCLGAAVCVLRMPATYEATAQVLVGTSEFESTLLSAIGISLQARTSPSSTDNDVLMETEIALATTEPVLQAVIDHLQLKDRKGQPLTVKKFTTWYVGLHALRPRPHVDVEQVEDSNVMEISARTTRLEDAARIANAVAESYIRAGVERRAEEFQQAHAFIEDRLRQVREDYTRALEAIRQFRVADAETGVEEDPVVVTAALTDNAQIAALKASLDSLKTELSQALLEKTTNHPDVVAMQKELTLTRATLRRELRVYQDAAVLEFELSNSRSLYSSLEALQKKLEMAERLSLSEIRLIQPARDPDPEKPKSPNKPLIVCMALALGGLAGLSLALLVHFMDDRVRTPSDLTALPCPVLGVIPYRRAFGPAALRQAAPPEALTEALRAIRNTLLAGNTAPPLRSLLLAGIERDDGCVTVAVLLGMAFAAAGRKVAIVDADLRRPRAHTWFDLQDNGGVTAFLTGAAPVHTLVQATSVPGLSLLSGGPASPQPAALMDSPKLETLLSELKRHYDMVMVACAPLGTCDDAMGLARHVETSVLVAACGRTTVGAITAAAGRYAPMGLALSGVILNRYVVTAANRW